jgi:hypothetical protein
MSTDHPTTSPATAAETELHTHLHESCANHTAAALRETEAATHEEIESALIHSRHAARYGVFHDVIEFIALARGGDNSEQVGAEVIIMAEAVASTLATPPALVPFAAKLITPTAFYSRFDSIRSSTRHLRCPILFAEDTDAVGTGSINPITALIMADFIEKSVHSLTGIKPFITAARMDYPSWNLLTRKHFES